MQRLPFLYAEAPFRCAAAVSVANHVAHRPTHPLLSAPAPAPAAEEDAGGATLLLPVQLQPLAKGALSRCGAEICMPTDEDVANWRRQANDAPKGKGWEGVYVERGAGGAGGGDGGEELRETVGFVTSGGYSWERGRPNGLGFATLEGLRRLFRKDALVGLCPAPPTASVRIRSFPCPQRARCSKSDLGALGCRRRQRARHRGRRLSCWSGSQSRCATRRHR